MFHPGQHLRKLIATMALGTICGCTEPVFEKLFSTEHFDYYVEQGATPPCYGTGEWLERYYAANAKFLGTELSAGKKIEYHLVNSTQSLTWAGCENAYGCAMGTTIYSLAPVLPHEIVHANAWLLGDPPLLFQEGLAEVLGCTSTIDYFEPLDTSAPIENMLDTSTFMEYRDGTDGHGSYRAAASFVRYLIDRFGALTFLSFYAQRSRNASRAEIYDIFEKKFGVPLDRAFADWRNVPPPLRGDLCLRLMECDPTMPLLANGDTMLQCGPSGGAASTREALFRFEVENQRIPNIETTPEISEPQLRSKMYLHRCSGGSVLRGYEPTGNFLVDKNLKVSIDPLGSTRSFVLDIPPGEYIAWFRAPAQAQIRIEMKESSSPMRDGCGTVNKPLVLKDKQQTILTSRWMERACSGFWCPGHSWDVAIGSAGGAIEVGAYPISNLGSDLTFAPDKVYLCSDPCPTDVNQCETLTPEKQDVGRVKSKQVFAPGTIVHVGAPVALLDEHFSLRMRLVPPCNGREPCTDPWHGPR